MSAEIDRETVRRARERLPEWTYEARDQAYTELFEGPDAALTDAELGELDRIDSDLTRRGEPGIWGADEYGIVHDGGVEPGELGVVCTYHPEIPYEGFRGEESLDEASREQYNDVLWTYCERVATYIQTDLDAFLRSASN
ncbi:DUF7539 family protein [Haloarchaeobius litoreus]|uniref:Uncharacterized protein n=1 Tax=Haloarchaeobius litoreus TaxID=755306 RepID=A0ABD6DNF5_9EURY|nr:hypothetical protein [Haloarchaeobius litoreus]